MERVTYNLHKEVCSIALRRSSSRSRSLAEHTLLLVALCGFGVLIISHISFVYRPSHSTTARAASIPNICLDHISGFSRNAEITHIVLSKREHSHAYTIVEENRTTLQYNETGRCAETDVSSGQDVCVIEEKTTSPSLFLPSQQDIILSYSKTKGFLFLPPSVCVSHNISTQYVEVARNDANCFGEPFLQSLVHEILGPDTVVLNWLVAYYDKQGFIHNPRTKAVTDLNTRHWKQQRRRRRARDNNNKPSRSWNNNNPLLFKAGVILTCIFLFFITTTLVSFTLRETQERMLHFTFQLQAYVREERPLAQLISTHVIENLVFVPIMVGMMFFLIEFYGGDKFLAFMVLSIVWVSEVFSIVAIRSMQGMHFFPKIFFLLFTLFHAYFFSCPFGFSYTALASTACFMLHSMVFFWNRFELPAVAQGLVTIDNPRATSMTTTITETPLMVPVLDEPTTTNAVVHNPPLVPPRHPLMLQHASGHSHLSMSSLGRNSMSRPPSSTGLPFRDGDDDGDDESYMYFMNGEVVMHRERNLVGRSPSISTNGSFEQQHEAVASNAATGATTTTDSQSARVPTIPQRIHATTVVDSSSFDERPTTSQALPTADRSPERPTLESSRETDVDLTPRIGSASRAEAQPVASRPAPVFPFWNFGRLRANATTDSNESS